MKVRLAPLILSLAAAGCAVGTDEPDSVGYVLLDREAQAAGELAHETWRGAPLLPVALDTTEPVAYSSPSGRVVFDLRPGALAYVHGPGGAVEWLRVGDDIGADRLRVHGTREGAAELARRLAGTVVSGGEGAWIITAPSILERASFMNVPEGVLEIAPDRAATRAVGVDKAPPGSGGITMIAPVGQLGGALDEAARQTMLVGVYTRGERAIVLDAEGGYSLEDACSGEVMRTGRYHTEEERVVLEGVDTLIRDAQGLRDASGSRFVPLAPPPEPEPEADSAAEGEER